MFRLSITMPDELRPEEETETLAGHLRPALDQHDEVSDQLLRWLGCWATGAKRSGPSR